MHFELPIASERCYKKKFALPFVRFYELIHKITESMKGIQPVHNLKNIDVFFNSWKVHVLWKLSPSTCIDFASRAVTRNLFWEGT